VWEQESRVCFQNHIHRVRFHGKISPYYGFRFFEYLKVSGEIEKYRKGVGISNMSSKALTSIPVPLPPVPEQLKIIKRIDELMARCDALEQLRADRDAKRLAVHTAAVRQLLNVADVDGHIQAREFLAQHFGELYTVKESVVDVRKAFLHLAISGTLTKAESGDGSVSTTLSKLIAEQRDNSSLTQKEREAVVAELQSAKENIIDNRAKLNARHFCSFITKGTTPAAEELRETGDIPFLKVYNIVGNALDFDYRPSFVSSNVHRDKLRRSVLYPGDVIMNIVGPPLGKVAVVTSQFQEWNMNQALAVFRPLAGISTRYIYYALSTEHVLKAALRDVKGTAGQDDLSLEQCRNLVISIPSIEEQERIVSKIDQFMRLCSHLETQIDQAAEKREKVLDAVLAQFGVRRCA
jgi:type I restriction enzyme S subunit